MAYLLSSGKLDTTVCSGSPDMTVSSSTYTPDMTVCCILSSGRLDMSYLARYDIAIKL